MNMEKVMKIYTSIGFLDIEKDWKIVKHLQTGMLYIQKKLDINAASLYAYLQENPHSNIVNIKECYINNEFLWVIEEYIQGKTLEVLLQEKKVLEESEVIEIIVSLCQALQHLHTLSKPIIHRDIKLENIMIDTFGRVILVDFDVARFYKRERNQDTTILGTEGYAAPEQFGFAQTDMRSDIYSLGIVMNYLLTGMHPREFMYHGSLEECIAKCIHLDPNKRYQNVTLLRNDLLFNKKRKVTPFWVIPGFRTKKKWKMIIASIVYGICIVSSFQKKSTFEPLIMQYIDNLGLCLMLLSLIALYTNYLDIQAHIDFFTSSKIYVKIWGYIVYTCIILFVFAFLIVALSMLFT